MRDVTPRANTDQGVTTGAAPARPQTPPGFRPDGHRRESLRQSADRQRAGQVTPEVCEEVIERSGQPARCFLLSAKHLVQFAAGIAIAEFGESPLLRNFLRRAHKAAPGGARDASRRR